MSDDGWLMYLYFDAPWPMPDSDCVQQLNISKSNGELKVTGTAKPKLYKMEEVGRMEIYDMTFHFQEQGQDTKFVLKASFAPVGSVPNWLLNTWFPEGPAGIIKRLLKNAK